MLPLPALGLVVAFAEAAVVALFFELVEAAVYAADHLGAGLAEVLADGSLQVDFVLHPLGVETVVQVACSIQTNITLAYRKA